jgi:hypothetical protein
LFGCRGDDCPIPVRLWGLHGMEMDMFWLPDEM